MSSGENTSDTTRTSVRSTGPAPVWAYAGFLALLVAAWCSPLREWLGHMRELSAGIREIGPMAPLVYLAGTTVLVALGAPRLVLTAIGALSFGCAWGLVLGLAGSLLGNAAVFFILRAAGRAKMPRKADRLARILEDGGIPAVVLVRLVPLHGAVLNMALAAAPVKAGDYMVGSFIGMTPYAIPAALAGTAATGRSPAESFGYAVPAVLISLLLWLLSRWKRS